VDKDIESLSKEELIDLVKPLIKRVEALEALVVELEAENEQLRQELGQKRPPSWVKRNRPKSDGPKEPRRKRAPEQNNNRRREVPTRTEQHALERCPKCSYRLHGESVDYTRQVIELPPPQPVEVIEHQVIKRYCPKCERWQSPKLDLGGQVFGQGRMGVRLASTMAYLRNTLRLPIRMIQDYLETLHQLKISIGEIVELLHDVRQATKGTLEALKGEMKASGILHGDETGWRESGKNGYIWSFSSPGEEAVRYYEHAFSRGQAVVKRILGDEFDGHLVSDFYCGYNDYAGKQQRCWIHLLRDLHKRKEKHSDQTEVIEWAQEVRKLYDEAQEWLKAARAPTREEREMKYVGLVGRSHELGQQYAQKKGHPCWALAKRILRHEDELFQFVLVAGLSADNNLAERSIRPLVVIRKISGGSRGEEGTKTRMALASLFQTWQARGLNPYLECLSVLGQSANAQPKTVLP
jgi:transposase